MKKLILSTAALLIAGTSFAQNDIKMFPRNGSVCNNMQLSLDIAGNSFNPVSYLWSTGETTPSITINTSGTYTLTVTGQNGNSNNTTTRTLTGNYTVLPAPTISQLTELWVCKGDTVKLQANSGYDVVAWSNGAVGSNFARAMTQSGGAPSLDTLNISYTSIINDVCARVSNTVLLRGIRKPNGVGQFYNGKMDIKLTDSIPAGTVLEYLYPVTYEMKFTDQSDPSNVVTYLTAPGSRKAPANILQAGKSYSVITRPIINNVTYCYGAASTIGLSSTNRIGGTFNSNEEGLKTYRVFDVSGRMILEQIAESFDQSWLDQFTPQMFTVHKVGQTTEVIKIQVVK
ncbi:MAG: PKD domain-containing protein [Bacteroidia bacterium]